MTHFSFIACILSGAATFGSFVFLSWYSSLLQVSSLDVLCLGNFTKWYLTACSIIVEYQSTAETSVVISFAIPYFSLSVALTIISTVLITVRLMAGRQVVQRVLGTSHSTPYVSVAAMIIESAAIYSIVGIFFVVFLITGNPGQNVLNPMIGQAMVRQHARPYISL